MEVSIRETLNGIELLAQPYRAEQLEGGKPGDRGWTGRRQLPGGRGCATDRCVGLLDQRPRGGDFTVPAVWILRAHCC